MNDNRPSLLYCQCGNYIKLRFRTIHGRALFKKEFESIVVRKNLNYVVDIIDSFGYLQEKNPRLFYYKKKNLPIPDYFREKPVHLLYPLYCYLLHIPYDSEEENYNVKEILDEVNNITKFTIIEYNGRKRIGQENIKIIWNFRKQLPKVTWKSEKE